MRTCCGLARHFYDVVGTPVCRLCGRYLAILGRPIRVTVPAMAVTPTALVGSLIRSSNLPHSLQRGVLRRQGRERDTDHVCLISCQYDCTKSSYNDLNFVQKHSDHPLHHAMLCTVAGGSKWTHYTFLQLKMANRQNRLKLNAGAKLGTPPRVGAERLADVRN